MKKKMKKTTTKLEDQHASEYIIQRCIIVVVVTFVSFWLKRRDEIIALCELSPPIFGFY